MSLAGVPVRQLADSKADCAKPKQPEDRSAFCLAIVDLRITHWGSMAIEKILA